ncbi:MAG: hypothetical protein ACRD72_19615 [Candidatus Angelobacter sp.]
MSESHESMGNPEPVADDMPTSVEIPQPTVETPQTPTQPAQSRKRRGLRILLTLLLIVVVLAACGFGGYRYAAQQYNQLSALGAQMCDNLETHKYDALYQHFSDGLKSKFTQEEFIRYGTEIDHFEGNVLSCGQTDANSFSVDLGQRAITVASLLNRDGSGTHSGNVRFQFTGNSWTVDSFDVGFLGVSLYALKAFDNACSALMARDYRSFYELMAPSLRTESQQQFLEDATLHQLIDGIALQCTLAGIGKANTEAVSTLSLHIRRVVNDVTDTVTFGGTPAGWAITKFDPSLQGRDITPVSVVARWCGDMKSQNYTDAFGLLTSRSQQFYSAQALAAKYSGKDDGVKWLDCTVNPTSYQGDTNVLLVAQLQDTTAKLFPGQLDGAQFALVQENSTWKIDVVLMCGNSQCSG